MIESIKYWVEGIIIAVIITILIEMLLPEGKNKKYVKVVSGIYILYTIINPILIKNDVSGFSDINEHFVVNTVKTSQESTIQETYIVSLEEYFKTQIETLLGYSVNDVKITCNSDFSEILLIEIDINFTEYDENLVKKIIIQEYQIDSNNIQIS